LILAVMLCPAIAGQAPSDTRRAEVRLVAETQGVQPSGVLWLGLHVTLRQGWHTYWANPGDSGEPARIKWTLPPGMTSGDIVWPAPHRLPNPPFMDFGYEREVLLLVPIRTDGLRARSATLEADVRLLVCKDVCVPEHSTVTLTLPVEEHPRKDSDVEPLFAAAKRRVPTKPPQSWRLRAEAGESSVILTIETRKPPSAVEFFPARPLEFRHAAAQPFRRTPAGASLTIEVDERRREPPPRVTGILVIDHDRSVTVDVPVRFARPL
jgi:thiol:disulfide interchange protein DsbD